jgi:hypothetical protein
MRDIVSEIIRRVNDEIREVDAALVTGRNIKEFQQYTRLLGKREGLQRTLDEINSILTEQEEAE